MQEVVNNERSQSGVAVSCLRVMLNEEGITLLERYTDPNELVIFTPYLRTLMNSETTEMINNMMNALRNS